MTATTLFSEFQKNCCVPPPSFFSTCFSSNSRSTKPSRKPGAYTSSRVVAAWEGLSYVHPRVTLRFFTTWNLLAVLLAPWTCRVLDLMLTSCCVSAAGLYLTYVSPCRVAVPCGSSGGGGGEATRRLVFEGPLLRLVDATNHHVVTAVSLYLYAVEGGGYVSSTSHVLATMLFFAFYTSLYDVSEVYGLRRAEAAAAFSAGLVSVLALRSTQLFR